MRTILFALLISTVAVGCKKKETTGESDKPAGSSAPAANLPALTADPEPEKITPADKTPGETIQFRMLAKRGQGGWPTFDAYNLGTKPVGFLPIYGYAYDKSGKQLARTKVPLSWNGKIEPGDKTSFSIDLGAGDTPVTADATTFQLCYTSLKYVDAADSLPAGECPDQRPKK